MTEDTYTKLGLEWIKEATMKKIFLKHYPNLKRYIPYENVFTNTWVGGVDTPTDISWELDMIAEDAGRVYAAHYAKRAAAKAGARPQAGASNHTSTA